MNEDHAPAIKAAIAAAAGRTGERIPAGQRAGALAAIEIARTAIASHERLLILAVSGERARSIRRELRRAGLETHLPADEGNNTPPAGSVTVSSVTRRALLPELEPDITILDLTDTTARHKNEAAEKYAHEAHVILTAWQPRKAPTDTPPAESSIQQRRGAGNPTTRRRVTIENLP